jgi:hypothetical protein
MDRLMSKMTRKPLLGAARFAAVALGLTVGAGGLLVSSCATDKAPGATVASASDLGGEKTMVVAARRITESQYKNSIADIFGKTIKVDGRFEPENRKDGLLAIGASALSISSSGFEQYFAIARSVSDQVLLNTPTAEAQKATVQAARDKVVTCTPASVTAADDKCTETFLRLYGSQLFRRPITDAEIAPRLKLAAAGAAQNKDYYHGLKLAMVSLLTAPEFLFRIEVAEVDPAKPKQLRLDAYTKAARLSHLLWDTTPDAELVRAAASGEIHTAKGLQTQIDRLSADKARMEIGLRAFFADMLQFDQFASLTKDAAAYPKFSLAVADGAREQTLKVLIDQLVAKNGDYRDIFTTRETFLNRPLAAVYQVPYTYNEEWIRYTFPEDSGQAGVLTQTTFMMLFSHPGKSSPTKRGVALHEIFMCEPTPLPPADVDFSKVRDSNEGTVRGRLLAHATNEGCAGCHLVSDPPGLALEQFDGLGQKRTTENGAVIDVSADWGGKKINGPQGLAMVLRDNPKIPACLVRNIYAYGVGQGTDDDIQPYLEAQTKAFAKNGYKVPALISQIAASADFYRVTVPKRQAPPAPANKVAEAAPQQVAAGK